MKTPRTALALGAGVAAAALLLSGCTATSPDEDSPKVYTQEEIDTAMSTPTELTFWTFLPDIDQEIALFEKEYPAITVKVENQGQEHNTKIDTAIESGVGGPDVIQVEYQFISSLRVKNGLLDLTPFGAGELANDYVPWVWNQVVADGKVLAIPQDSGPMGNLYRQDILEQAGVTEAPATWEDYASAAEKVKSSTGSYISNLASNDPSQMVGLLWQAGVKPFGYDGDKTVNVAVNTPEAKEVLAYWQDLVDRDLISTDGDFNDEWYQGLAQGKYAGWLTAAWAPVFLSGTAKDTSGLWRAAPLPQWDASNPSTGNWGGSANAVLAQSKNPIAAAVFVQWLNHESEPTLQFTQKQSLFPTLVDTLQNPEFADAESDFFGGQKVNSLFADISGTVDTKFEWLPYMTFAYQSYNDTVGKAIAEKGDFAAGLDAWQQALVDYGTKQGFTVTEG